MEGPGAGCVLWSAERIKTPVARAQLEERWKRGELSGLFNLPSRALFDACSDFVEVAAAPSRAALQADLAAEGLRREEFERECKEAKRALDAAAVRAQQAEKRAAKASRRMAVLNAQLDQVRAELRATFDALQAKSDTLEAVVAQNKALVLDLAAAREAGASAPQSPPVARDQTQDQTAHLNALLLRSFLRNIDAAVKDEAQDEWE